jgi:hypothetical protein
VRARIASGSGVETYEADPRGNVTLCTGAVPVYEAPDYRPHEFTWVKPPDVPKKKPGVSSPAERTQAVLPPVSNSGIPTVTPDPPCPPFGAKEIGSFNKLGTQILAGYELQGGECVKVWASVPASQVLDNYLPEAGPTVSVALTAAFATTAAIFAKPVASVLQKLAKPVTKKMVKRLDQRLGRKEKRGSLQERRAAQRDRNAAIHDLRRALGR